MKKKVKKSLSDLQQRRLVRISLLLLGVALLWLFLAPKMGFFSLTRENDRFQELENQRRELEKENAELRLEMEKIQNDIEHFEEVARQQGLLRENEIIFDFSKGGEEGKE